jgi:HAD superfamily hydrolase (TIGR01509 family)
VQPPELILPGRFRAAVFDFDGLLVDSEPAWARSEERLLARHGHAYTEEDRRETVGRSIDQSIAAYAARLGLPSDQVPALRAELVALARSEYVAAFPTRPGAVELVAALDGRMRLAVASNTDRELVEAGLAATPFATSFDVVVAGDDGVRSKPAPDLYVLACGRLGVAPRDAIAFEDSASGVQAGRAAGLTVVAVPSVPGVPLDGADYVLASLGEVRVGS